MSVQSPMPDAAHDSRSSARTKVLESAARDAINYLENVDARPVAPLPEAVAALNELRGPLPEAGAALK